MQFFKVLSHVIELLRDCWIRLHIYISRLIVCILCLTWIKGCSCSELSRSHSTRLYSNFIRILFERGCFIIWRLWYSLFHLFQLIPTATSVRNYSCIDFWDRGKLKFIGILTEFFRFNSTMWIVYLILCWQSVLKNKLVFITTLKMGSSCCLSWVYDTLSWNLHIRGSSDEVSFTKLFTRIETIAIICVHWNWLYLRQHHHICIELHPRANIWGLSFNLGWRRGSIYLIIAIESFIHLFIDGRFIFKFRSRQFIGLLLNKKTIVCTCWYTYIFSRQWWV